METIRKEVKLTKKRGNQKKELLTSNNSKEILCEVSLTFSENFIVESSSNCDPYGCTCIAYEKCCGCILQ